MNRKGSGFERFLGVGCVMLVMACGAESAATNAAEPVAEPSISNAASSTASSADPAVAPVAATSEDEARRGAVAQAERFVRAQGYTSAPPSVPDGEIVHEGIEGSVAARRGQLRPEAVEVHPIENGWMVLFAYQSEEYEGRGRALILEDEGTPRFVHQDAVLGCMAGDAACSP